MYEKRDYRNILNSNDLTYFNVCVEETDLFIGAFTDLTAITYRSIIRFRSQLNRYISDNPHFLTSLKPIDAENDAPEIVKMMCRAAKYADVGPMAAVAGAISEMVGIELLKYSSEVIIENGGDIFIKSDKIRKIAVYAGASPLSGKIALEVDSSTAPLGICTSSGTVGHSLSFGKADAALVTSEDTSIADGAATALGNMVKTSDDIEYAINRITEIDGVKGALVIIGDKIGVTGDLKLVRI